jgi:hypothetical protein
MTIAEGLNGAAPGTAAHDGAGAEACSRCGRGDGQLVHAGWADWPDDVLRRIGASNDVHLREVLVHPTCAAA